VVSVLLCNASKSVNHHIDGLTVRVELRALTGDLNSWQFCDAYYQNGQAMEALAEEPPLM
jgi:hypothetical protein